MMLYAVVLARTPDVGSPALLNCLAVFRAAGPPAPVVHHLLRVQRPLPSQKHPLAGLWRGSWRRGLWHGVSIVQVVYDFTGPAARILATQVRE